MSLIESMMVNCTRLIRTVASDGVLGHEVTYRKGAGFRAAIILQKPQQVTEAERPDFHDEYTVVVYAGTALAYQEVFMRDSDSAVFRVTGDPRDTQAPAMSSVQIAKTTAERFDLDGELEVAT